LPCGNRAERIKKMTEEKYVTYRHLKKGQEISGAKQGNSWHSFKGYVKEVNAAYVILELWNPGGPEERFPSEETLFGIEMTRKRSKKNTTKWQEQL
jgi:hypothetical protein